MMRDSRRRSPEAESSRRRRRDRERDRDRKSSRDQPTTTTDRAADAPDYYSRRSEGSYSRGITTQDRDRSATEAASSSKQPWMGDNPDYYTAEPDPIPHSSQQPPQPRSRRRAHARAPSSSGSDSSSSLSYLDISRRYDTSRFGGVLNAFFRAPSEHRRQQRRVKTRAKKRAVLPFGNSSSSSINSDLAYGEGYIPQSKSSSRRSRNDGRRRSDNGDPFQPGKLQRRQTDEEIVAIGRQLSDLAKRQNEEDLRAAGRNRPSKIMGAAAGLASINELRKSRKDSIRGIGSSKPTGRDSDDEDWESATDDDSSDDDASALAYGSSRTNLPGVLGGAAAAAAGAGALWGSQRNRRTADQQRPGVDPSLFGPVNSLNGMVTPVPFRDNQQYNNGYDRRRDAPITVTESVDNVPMRQVYPVPTSQPDQFDARHSASLSGSKTDDLPKVIRPGPAPIQAPVPIAPVSSKVYDAQSLEDVGRREERERRRARERDDESRGMSSTAKIGLGTAATAAVAAAALQSRHQRGRDEDYRSYAKVAPKKLTRGERSDHERRRSERDYEFARDVERDSKRDRDREREKEKEREREREYRKSKGSTSSKSKDDREYKRSSRHDDFDDFTSKRSETGKDKDRRSSRRDIDEIKVEYDDDKPSRRSRREEKMPADRDLTKDMATGAVVAGGAALAAGALASGTSTEAPERPLTPAVFTVDREPSFDDWPPRSPSPDVRLSRKDSFEIERMAEDSSRQASRSAQEYTDTQRDAKSIYDEAKQATVPVGAAAVAAAVAAESGRDRERGRRRDDYSDDGSRERSRPVKDSVQEEADRYYREAQAARKVAEEEVRSRSRSKRRDNDSKADEEPEIAIVTPPGYEEDKKLEKSPYDAPNADVRIDNQIFPAETHRFRSADGDLDAPVWKSRDPSAERERPLLNLVLPTPMPSREPTPAPADSSRSVPAEEQTRSSKSDKSDKKKKDKKKGKKSKDRDQPASTPEPGVDVVIGPKGDIIQTPSTPKSVTWGENETKNYEVESPEQERKDSFDKERPRLNKASKWGILAAAIAGSSTEPANEPEPVSSDTSKPLSRSSDTRDRGLDDVGEPPIPGPKPGSNESKQMPGGFADDVEFAGTLAAGLEDAGFDPNIVVNDPTYRRRDSPPGSDELHDNGLYKKAFSETVEDLSNSGAPMTPGSGFVIGETETPKDEGADEWAEIPVKLSKKEKRKQEKAAASKRQSMDLEDAAPSEPIETQTTESFTEIPLSKKEQKKRAKAAKAKALAGDDDWDTAGQGTETPPSQTQGTETPPSWDAGEDEWEAPSSSKKKKGKNRKSKDFSEADDDKVSVPVDAFTDIQRDINPEDEWEAPKKSKKSKNSSPDSPAQSAPASEASSEVGGRKKSKRRSMQGDDFNEWDGDPPDRKRVDPFEERDVSSVVSEPRYDDRRRDSKSKRSSRFDDDDDTKSIASAPGGSRKSKDSEKRSSGIFSSIFSKSNGHKDDDSKKESFLDNAGTLGAGVGLAGAAAVIAAASRQHATEASSETEQHIKDGSEPTREIEQSYDPEIVHRVIKPAIDPQYGDLLPLPPSEPGSPKETPEELPELPDSRPDTPPEERNLRQHERMAHVRRRSAQELPMKSPSRTAIPIQLRLGPRSNPGTPGFLKSSPLNSPGTPDSAGPHKRSARPTSWDSSRGPIPLQLPRHVRHGSTGATAQEADLPAIDALRDMPEAAAGLTAAGLAAASAVSDDTPMHIDIGEPHVLERELAGSQESTPKAEIKPEFPVIETDLSGPANDESPEQRQLDEPAPKPAHDEHEPEPVDPMSKNRSSYLLNSTPSSIRSDRSVDAESLAQSPPSQLTPSKQRTLGADLSDIPEDLTSADEHFTDARSGESEDDFFEEARSALSSEVSSRDEPPATTTPTRSTFAETWSAPDEKTAVESDQEWGTAASKKKSKKAKKKAAKAAAASSSSWDTAEDDSMMSTPLAGPATTDKGLGPDADIPSVAVSGPEAPTDPNNESASRELKGDESAIGDTDVQDRDAPSAETPNDEPELTMAPSKKDKKKKKKEKKQKQAESAFDLPSESTDDKDQTGTFPATNVTGADDSKPETADYYPSAASLHAPKDKAESPEKETNSQSYFPSAARVLPVAVPAAVAAGLALKDHWDSKSGDLHEPTKDDTPADRSGEPMQDKEDVASLNTAKEQVPDETPVSEALFSQPEQSTQDTWDRDVSHDSTQVADELPDPDNDASKPADEQGEDEWAIPVSSKKSKKNKKKKGAAATSAMLDDEPASLDKTVDDQEPVPSFVEPQQMSVEAQDTPPEDTAQVETLPSAAPDAGEDEWAPATTSKKKGKKNKKKQAAPISAWDEPQAEEPPAQIEDLSTSVEEQTAVPNLEDLQADTSRPVEEPTGEAVDESVITAEDSTQFNAPDEVEDEWAALTAPKKKSKKNKKKDTIEFPSWDEEVRRDDPLSDSRDLPSADQAVESSKGDVAEEGPVSTELVEPSSTDTPGEAEPEAQPQETQAEDEWAMPKSAKAKKKDKKKKRQALGLADEEPKPELQALADAEDPESKPTTEEPISEPLTADSTAEDATVQGEKASFTDLEATAEPIHEPSAEPALETPTTEAPGPTEPAEDEWASITKKGKKNKKNKKLAAASWDEEPVEQPGDLATESLEPTAETRGLAADPEAEFEVPKKGKKGKKNKGIALAAWDAEPSSQDPSQDPAPDASDMQQASISDPAVDPEAEFEAPKKKKKGKKGKALAAYDTWADEAAEPSLTSSAADATTAAVDESSRDIELAAEPFDQAVGAETSLDTTAPESTPDGLRLLTSETVQDRSTGAALAGNDLETPASGALFAVNDLASPLKPTEFTLSLDSLQESAEPTDFIAATEPISQSDQTQSGNLVLDDAQEQLKEAPQEADDSEFLFPMKKKKGKKGKKSTTEADIMPDTPENDATTEAKSKDATHELQQQDQPEAIHETPIEPSDATGTEPLPATDDPIPTTAIDPEPKDDADFGFIVKPSKKDKKKKKGKAIDVSDEPTTHESASRGSSAEDKDDKALYDHPSVEEPRPTEEQPVLPSGSVEGLESPAMEPDAQVEDEWTAPATSKKDKKKKKKAAALAWADDEPSQAQEDLAKSVSEGTPADTGSPAADDWATPTLSKKDKKKKKKQAALDWTESEIATETAPQEEPSVPLAAADTQPEEPHDQSEAPIDAEAAIPESNETTTQPEVAAAEDEWATPALSKKDKKKKKKQAQLDWTQEETPKDASPADAQPVEADAEIAPVQPDSAPIDDWTEPVLSKKDKKKKKKKQAELDWADESSTPQELETSVEVSTSAAEAAPDENWEAPVLSKKDKKKKKKAAALAWGDESPIDVPATGTEDSAPTDADHDKNMALAEDTPIPTVLENEAAQAFGSDTLETPQDKSGLPLASIDDPEPEYGFSLSKKDKKKKKKAKAAAFSWDEEPAQVEGDPARSADTPAADDSATNWGEEDAQASYTEPTSWQAATEEWSKEPSASWDDPEPPREEDEDSWDVTAPKSKKKKKKSTVQEEAPVDAPETSRPEETFVAPVEVPSSAPVTAEDDDDEWAALVTGTKSKATDESEDLPWAQSRDSHFDEFSQQPGRETLEDTSSKSIVPEDIATVDDLRQILSGPGPDKEKLATQPEPEHSEQTANDTSHQRTDATAEADPKDTAPPVDQDRSIADADHTTEVLDTETKKDDAPVTQEPDEQTLEADTWMAPVKLSKKDKKKKKKQGALAFDDTTGEPSTAAEDRTTDDTHVDESSKQLAEETIATVSEPQDIAVDQSESVFDDWAPKKLSKKDKKKAEKAARFAAMEPDPAEALLEPESTADQMQPPEDPPSTADQPAESTTPQHEASPEVDEWAPKLSKKDKKKKAKAAQAAAFAFEDNVAETSEPQTTEAEVAPEAQTEMLDRSLDTNPDEDEWAPKLSKKDKKKKAKAAQAAAFEASEPVQEAVPEPNVPEEPAQEEVPTAPEESLTQEQQPELDEWAPKLSKKDKKKAAKAAQLAAFDAPEPSPELPHEPEGSIQENPPVAIEDTPAQDQQPELDEWAPKLSKKNKKKAAKAAQFAAAFDALEPSTGLGQESEEPVRETPSVAAEDAPAEEQQPEVDDWAPKLSKKDKKKAAKAAQLAAFDAPEPSPEWSQEPTEPVKDSPSFIVEDTPAQEQQPEVDEWAPKLSKKDKKKAAKAAQLASTDAFEPGPETIEDFKEAAKEEISTAPEEPITQEQQPEFDEWAPKMSKKDKKKAEKAARLAALTPEEPTVERLDSPADDPPATLANEPVAKDAMQEDEEWAPKLSKKDKKKAEKAARLAALTMEESPADSSEPSPVVPTEDTAAQEQVHEPTQEDPPEVDEWAPKMSKKDKKKAEKAARLAALAEDEPSPAADLPSQDSPIATTESLDPTPAQDEAQPEVDDWVPKKLSKKEQKKADKLARAAQLLADDTPTDTTPSDTVMDDGSNLPEESFGAAEPAEAQPDFDDWSPKKTSKKDKKKAEKLARAAALSAGLAVAGTAINSGGDRTGEPEPAARSAVAEGSEGVESAPGGESGSFAGGDEAKAGPTAAEEAGWDSPHEQRTTSTDLGVSQVPDTASRQDVDESLSAPPADPTVAFDRDVETLNQDKDLVDEGPAERADDPMGESWDMPPSDRPQEETTPPEPVPEEDEWALPVKKKGKKNKKTLTGFAPADEPEPTEEVLPAEPATRDIDTTMTDAPPAAPEPEVTGDDFWAVPTKTSKKAKKGKKKGSQDATPIETPRAASPLLENPESEPLQTATIAEEPAEPAPEVEQDPWEVPVKSSKKNKKGKKKASQEPTPTETPRAASPTWDDPVVAATPTEAQDAPLDTASPAPVIDNDDWASGFPTSTSKKKKKKDRKSTSAFMPDPEPTPAERDIPEPPPETSQEWTSDRATESIDPPQGPGFGSMAMDPPTQDLSLATEQTTSRNVSDAGLSSEPVQVDTSHLQDAPSTVPHGVETVEPTEPLSPKEISESGPGFGALGAAAAGTATVGGVAAMAEKFGGGKKKKGSKKKKILDKRQPREDDLFDDPALWESADKKGLDDVEVPKETEDFWSAGAAETEESKGPDDAWDQGDEGVREQEKSRVALPTPSSDSPASESGWKETARQGARLDDDFEESPVLGRGEKDPRRSGDTGPMQFGSDSVEADEGWLREDSQSRSLTRDRLSDSPDFKRSPSRGLPVVQEIPESETEASKEQWSSPEVNRDSGFVTDSPHPLNRSSKTFDDVREEPQRDSGVHTDDWDEPAPRTPGNRWDHKLRRSPQSTPRLREPVEQAATPEPAKRRSKNYGPLADEASTPSRGISGPGAAAAAAALAAGGMGGRESDPRSVSEGHAGMQHGPDASPSPSLTSQRGEQPLRRTASNTSIVRQRTPEPLKFRPESPGIRSTPTPPLRRVNRRISSELPAGPASRETNTPKPVANETKVRVRDKDKDMADVYDGFGEGRIGSPRSPTRPHSMRRRQSMQVLELESKVEQLIAENRLLSDARNHAEQNLSQRATSVLSERDAEIENLKQSLQFLQNEVSRLTEVNEGLTSANAELASKDNGRYAGLEANSGDGSRGLDLAAGGAAGAAAGAAATVASYQQSIQEKDDEIAELRSQLEDAREKVREMQRQILASKAGDAEFLDILDEDHFDHRCQQLCSHVQQWVLRFSKFSDMRACRLTSEINDEKTIDRLDNAVLDGSDVDVYLNDRVRRRDIFMSMTMNMIWEFVFTRYLFGMDREQRQKLKSLEKLLTEVGPPQAVRQWRAVTLTLLSRRDSFKEQRDLDTEAVVQAIYQTLCKILPPPSNLEGQIQSQLRRVMAEAVALSIQMRTQKAEYMMLPPLQPEYDADGELAANVYFNASMMNERSGSSSVSNEELEAQQAKVRIVLFPLVVKKGDDTGVGDEEIVVCPAQVVVARSHSRRSMAPSSDAGGASLGGAPSRVSVVTEHMT